MSESSEHFTWAVRSDVGRVREINQDSASADPTLFVVADGMGGHRGGEVASAVAVETMTAPTEEALTVDAMIARVRAANAEVIERAAGDPNLAGMGTTLCSIGLLEADWKGGTRLGLVNVGDSRIYRFVDDTLEQVSDDHSLVGSLMRDGHLTPDEAAVHPQRNIVTRALGIAEQVDVDYWELPARRGEQFLLCSDGLVDEVSDNQIAATFRRLADPGEIADELVRQANEAGARDNVTVLIVRVDAGVAGEPDLLKRPHVASADGAPAAEGKLMSDEPAGTMEASADPPVDASEAAEGERRRFSTTHVGGKAIAFVGIVVAIIVAGFALIGTYARDNYFVGFDQDQVVVYQGRPGGVLWFDPTIEDQSTVLRDDLSDALELQVEDNPEFGSFDEASAYVDELGSSTADPADQTE